MAYQGKLRFHTFCAHEISFLEINITLSVERDVLEGRAGDKAVVDVMQVTALFRTGVQNGQPSLASTRAERLTEPLPG